MAACGKFCSKFLLYFLTFEINGAKTHHQHKGVNIYISFLFYLGYNNRYGKRVLTILEAIKMLNELSSDGEDTLSDNPNKREVDMIMIPPKVDVLTDNEDINENELHASQDIPVDIAGEIEIQQSQMVLGEIIA